MFYLRRKRIVFVHIPRTGGGSISRALFNKNNKRVYHSLTKWIIDDLKYREDEGRTKVGGHATAMALELRCCNPPWSECESFAVTRHPFDRALSLWRAVQIYREPDIREQLNRDLGLDEFVRDWIVGGKLGKNLRRPQWRIICNQAGDESLVRTLFRFEDGPKLVGIWLSKRVGRGLDIEHHAAYTQPGDRELLTWENKVRLQDYYADDFERLGY